MTATIVEVSSNRYWMKLGIKKVKIQMLKFL